MKTKILYSGRSMIERLGVLAIMGIITGMSIAAYNMAMGTLKSGRTTEDITKIQEKIMFIMKNYDDVSDKIKSFREKNIYNFGSAGAAAAEHIINILKEEVEK